MKKFIFVILILMIGLKIHSSVKSDCYWNCVIGTYATDVPCYNEKKESCACDVNCSRCHKNEKCLSISDI